MDFPEAQEPKAQPGHTLKWWPVFLALSFACFGWAIPGGFIWDENTFLKNSLLRTQNGLVDIWLRPELNAYESHYWPVTYTGFWLQAQLFGLNASGFKVVSIILHSVVCMLVLVLMRRLSVPGARWIALVFCVHPVHAETVCWAIEQKGLLASIFALGSVLLFPLPGSGRGRLIVSVALFVAALLSKSSVVPLPIILALLVWWKRGRLDRTAVLQVLPFAVLAIVYAAIDLQMVRGRETLPELPGLFKRVVIAIQALGMYVTKLIWPLHYATIYPKWEAFAAPAQTASAVASVALVGVAIALARKAAVVAIGSYVALLLPVIGLVGFYFMKFAYIADRFQYLASLPVLALGIAMCAKRFGSRMRWLGLIAVIVLAGSSMYYARMWSDAEMFWRRQVQRNPELAIAKNNLALELHLRGYLQESEKVFLQAIESDPADYRAHSNLGALYTHMGRHDAAITAYQAALDLDPGRAQIHNNLGLSLQQRGEFAGARRHFEEAIRLAPDYANALVNLGALCMLEGRQPEAAKHFREALRYDPSHALATRNLRMMESRR